MFPFTWIVVVVVVVSKPLNIISIYRLPAPAYWRSCQKIVYIYILYIYSYLIKVSCAFSRFISYQLFNWNLIEFFNRRGEWHRGRGYDWNGARFGAPWWLVAPSQHAATSDARARPHASDAAANAPRRW